MSKIENLTDCRGSRARSQQVPGSRQAFHHSGVQEDLAAPKADVSLNGYLRHVVAFSDAALDKPATVELTAASGTYTWPLFRHLFTRVLRSTAHRAGSGR